MNGKQLAEEREMLKKKLKTCDKKQREKLRKRLQANLDLFERYAK